MHKNAHKKNKIHDATPAPGVLDKSRRFQCDICSKSFDKVQYLDRHKNVDHPNSQVSKKSQDFKCPDPDCD